MTEVVERRLAVGDMHYAIKIWGENNAPTVIALHGWLDNVASFDRLGELLEGYRFIAIDLAGHGLTSHRPASGGYQIWDDVVDILDIARALNCERFTVMGHSRGAMIASLVAVAAPDRVEKLIQLDGFFPMIMPVEQTADQLKRHVQDALKYRRRVESGRAGPIFKTVEEMAEARRKVMPMSKQSAMRLIVRNTRPVDGGFTWRFDDRLKAASAVKMTLENNQALVQSLSVPTLFLCQAGMTKRLNWIDGLLAKQALIHREYVDGVHHFHMEEQSVYVAKKIVEFIR